MGRRTSVMDAMESYPGLTILGSKGTSTSLMGLPPPSALPPQSTALQTLLSLGVTKSLTELLF